MENGGAFYDPRSLSSCKNHTSSFPGLQHHRPITTTECVEKKQSKHRRKREKRCLGRKYLQLDLRCIHHQRESLSSSWRNTAFRGQSQRAMSQSWLGALCLQQDGLLGQTQQRCSNAWTPHRWVGNRAQICFEFLKSDLFLLMFYLARTKMNDITSQMEREDLQV